MSTCAPLKLTAFNLASCGDDLPRDENTTRGAADTGLPVIDYNGRRGVIVNDLAWHEANAEDAEVMQAMLAGIHNGYFGVHAGMIEGLTLTLIAVCMAGDGRGDYGTPGFDLVPLIAERDEDGELDYFPIVEQGSDAGSIISTWDRDSWLTGKIAARFCDTCAQCGNLIGSTEEWGDLVVEADYDGDDEGCCVDCAG